MASRCKYVAGFEEIGGTNMVAAHFSNIRDARAYACEELDCEIDRYDLSELSEEGADELRAELRRTDSVDLQGYRYFVVKNDEGCAECDESCPCLAAEQAVS